MRSPSHSHSALRAPLSDILGTEVNVRIVRLLARTTVPMSKAAVARHTSLNASGVGRAITALVDLGIAESLGAGSRLLYRLRKEHPLAAPLVDVFAAERARFESIIDGLGAVVTALVPPPRAAWIQGPVATRSDEPGDPVVVGILASAKCVDETVDQLRAGVSELEQALDVTVAVYGLTSADMTALPKSRRADLEDTMPLLGPPPLELLTVSKSPGTGAPARSHGATDASAALDFAQLPRERIADLCRRHRIRRLAVFGSALRDDFAQKSDLDVLVEFEPGVRVGLAFFAIQQELSEMIGRKVDLNTVGSLSKHFRDEVLTEARDIYVAA